MITINAHRPGHKRTRVVPSNPLKADPTRTATLRRMFQTAMRNRFYRLKGKILRLIVDEDVFGLKPKNRSPAQNTRFAARTDPEKVVAFRKWLQKQIDADIIPPELPKDTEKLFWNDFVEKGYRKGAGRAFDDVKVPAIQQNLDFFNGTKEEFLRQSFAKPQSINKIKLLVGRVYTDLKGVTDVMASQLSRELAEGFAAGQNPRQIAKNINNRIDKIGITRARTIARTEVIRSHAEGQLDTLEDLGVKEVGVAVEWSTAGDDRVCPQCQPMEGVVLKMKEARGTIPLHPNCRCAYIPANVGEDKKGQKRSKTAIEKAQRKSIQAEHPKLSFKEAKKRSRTQLADKEFDKIRPKSILDEPVKRVPKPKPVQPETAPTKVQILPDTDNAVATIARSESLRLESKFDLKGVPPVEIESVVGKSFKADTIIKPDSTVYGTYEAKHRSRAGGLDTLKLSSKLEKDGIASVGGSNVGNDMATAFRHEYGHHLQEHLPLPVDPTTKRNISWQRLSKKYVGKDKPISVSDFARGNHQELYAESFAVYSDSKYVRGSLPKDIEEFFDLALKLR
ncbi:minor capsid protein [bacterium]|nr:minor capsid protein [bacterium]